MEKLTDTGNVFLVVGATINQEKYGYKVLMTLVHHGLVTYGINPNYNKVGWIKCYPTVADFMQEQDVQKERVVVVTVVPPGVTEQIVRECADIGIQKVWMQPGSESEEAVDFCEEQGISVVYNACLVNDGFHKPFVV